MAKVVIDSLSKPGPQDCITVYCGDWRCSRHSKSVDLDIPALMGRHGDVSISGLQHACAAASADTGRRR